METITETKHILTQFMSILNDKHQCYYQTYELLQKIQRFKTTLVKALTSSLQ